MWLERNDREGAALLDVRRTRRLRGSAAVRDLVRETALGPDDFIQPLFVTHGSGIQREIGSMPGQFQLSVDVLPREIAELAEMGIRAVILFGIPEEKARYADDQARDARDVGDWRRLRLRIHRPRSLRHPQWVRGR